MFLRPQNWYAREKKRALLGKEIITKERGRERRRRFLTAIRMRKGEGRNQLGEGDVRFLLKWVLTHDRHCRAVLLLWLERKMSIHYCGPRRETLKMLIDMLVWCLLWLCCQCRGRWRRTRGKTGGHVMQCWECEEEKLWQSHPCVSMSKSVGVFLFCWVPTCFPFHNSTVYL